MSVAERPTVSALVVNHNSGEWLRRCLESLQAIAEAWRSEEDEERPGGRSHREEGAERLGQRSHPEAASAGPGDRNDRLSGDARPGRRRLRASTSSGRPGAPAGLEAVVVDNASSDGSLAAVREFTSAASSALPVRCIEAGRNLGFGAASNLAAAQSTGRHLLLLNPDAWIDAKSLRRLVEALESDEGLGVAAPALHYPDGSRQFVWNPTTGVVGEAIQRFRNRFEPAAWNHGLLPRLLRSFVGAGWYTAACLLVRRRAFEEVDGFDETFFLYFEDADLGLRLRRAGFRQREVTGARAWHARGATTAADGERHLKPEAERRYRASQLRYYELQRPAWERAVLRRRLRRKFQAIRDNEHRRAMLRLLGGR